MGSVCSGIQADLLKAHPANNKKKGGKGGGPTFVAGGIYFFEDYQALYKAVKLDGDKADVTSVHTAEAENFDWDASVKPVAETPLAPFAPTFQVTAKYRGEEVNGYVEGFEGSKFMIHFKPDPAHQADKTDWTLGSSQEYTQGELKVGHCGKERPRVRNADEKKVDMGKIKGYGVAYIHCGNCGLGIWEDPCTCMQKAKRTAWHCQQCGKKAASGNAICCGKSVKSGAQNQGWANVLWRQAGQPDF